MNTGKEMLMVIVDRDTSDEVIEVARQAGAQGATVLHGRGTGHEDKLSAFHIHVEPQKELVMMAVEADQVDSISQAIAEALDFNQPGTGILFILPINETTGLYEG